MFLITQTKNKLFLNVKKAIIDKFDGKPKCLSKVLVLVNLKREEKVWSLEKKSKALALRKVFKDGEEA